MFNIMNQSRYFVKYIIASICSPPDNVPGTGFAYFSAFNRADSRDL
jgi:hypothetical protein